ncbi:MAG: BON domain-containing protein, partial [Candidatus Acidiferrum sp.]
MHRSRPLLTLLTLALFFSVACNNQSDDSIALNIKAKMFSEPLLKTSTVNVSVKSGTVTLSGQLADDAARLAAERIAADTKGVTKVIDQTTVPIRPREVAEDAPPSAPAPARPVPHPPRTPRPQAAPAPSNPPAPSRASEPENPPAEQSAAAAPVPAAAPAPPPPPPTPPPPQPVTATIPGGAVVTVRTIDNIDSSTSQTGETFRASLDAPILVDGRVVAPKGLNVNLQIVTANS